MPKQFCRNALIALSAFSLPTGFAYAQSPAGPAINAALGDDEFVFRIQPNAMSTSGAAIAPEKRVTDEVAAHCKHMANSNIGPHISRSGFIRACARKLEQNVTVALAARGVNANPDSRLARRSAR